MTSTRPSTIQEAPSLADITSAGDRVGKVDFTAKLGDRMDPTPQGDAVDQAAASLASMARPQRPAGETEPDVDGPRLPFILPPATVDLTMAAEAQRTKHEIAAARGELPDDEPEVAVVEPAQPETSETEAEGEAPIEAGLAGPRQAPAVIDPVDSGPSEPARASGPSEGLVIHAVADLEALAATVAQREAEDERRVDAAEVTRLRAESEAAAQAAQESLARAASAIGPTALQAPRDEADEAGESGEAERRSFLAAPLRSVTEVADAVIASMRQVNQAHERHVESLELETARRCELLTAQAELDAELIRLHARREAHAIISAARMRSGELDPETVETDQLGEIGETFSRFAEDIETTVATSPAFPDHLRKS